MTTVLNALLVVGGLASSLVLSATEGGAQPAPGTFRVGFLSPSSAAEPRAQQFLNAFRQGLRELGYVEGQNIAIEARWADGKYARLPDLVAELVRLSPVICRWSSRRSFELIINLRTAKALGLGIPPSIRARGTR